MVPQPDEAKYWKSPPLPDNSRLLEELIAAHGPLLNRQAERNSQRPGDAEDALHDAYALFLERYHGHLPALPYLLTTVKHSAWEIPRRASRQRERSVETMRHPDSDLDPWALFPDPALETEDLAERHSETERQRAAILALKADERRALLLLGAGLTYKEICEITNWTHTKVNRCLAEGKAALRQRLSD